MTAIHAQASKAGSLLYAPLAFAAGALASFAMEPSNAWPVFFVALPGLYVLLTKARTSWQAALIGFLFGLGYFLLGLWWIGNALLVDGNEFAWVWPISVVGLPTLLSLFPAAACYICYRWLDLKTIRGYFGFTACLLLFEWLRGNILSGFPWNLFGYAWADVPELVQVVSLGGIYTLTWLTIIWAALPGFLIVGIASRRNKIILNVSVIVSVALSFGFGHWRISATTLTYHDNAVVKIVQPNIPQAEKWDRSRMTENFFKNLRLSYPTDNSAEATYIVWPETAISHWYTKDAVSMNLIKQALQSYNGKAYLITGLLRHDPETGSYGNSVVMIDRKGNISNIYDKTHLVPFGEFIPLQKWIPIKPVANFSGFKAGAGSEAMITPEGLRYVAMVCYEIIFSGIIPHKKGNLPDFIINVTNDAWYGMSAGPYQHFTNASFRAVEEGIPLIRSANTGISALINPLGQVEYRAELSVSDSKTLRIPHKIGSFYTAIPFQNAIIVIIALFVIVFACARKLRATNRSA